MIKETAEQQETEPPSEKGTPAGTSISVIVKPTSSCNLACTYCYTDSHAEQGFMDEKTLEVMTRSFLQAFDRVDFIWHGGEPLLLPISFYQRACDLQQEICAAHKEKRVKNGFQTNGTLVTDTIINFCQDHHFTMGFSLDGSAAIHDRTRPYHNGRSSFAAAFSGMKRAIDAKVGSGAITVLSRRNIDDLLDIYAFARQEQFGLKLNPLIKSGCAVGHYDDLGILPGEYGQALIQLFDIWFEDTNPIPIDPFDLLMGNILTEEPRGCNYSKSCQEHFISIGPTGDVYPCGRFHGVQEFFFGNLHTLSLPEILQGSRRRELLLRSVPSCEPCDYKPICNSGCMHDAYTHAGTIHAPDYYCQDYKMLISHIKPILERELAKAEVHHD